MLQRKTQLNKDQNYKGRTTYERPQGWLGRGVNARDGQNWLWGGGGPKRKRGVRFINNTIEKGAGIPRADTEGGGSVSG